MPAPSSAAPRTVLVTGASTGIGAACARTLAARGWRVFAGVRKLADGEALAAGSEGRIIPLQLDVTNRDQIQSVVREISAQCGEAGLQGVVNNAGIALAGPLEFMPLDAFQRQFDVNVLGLVAVTQAVLPLIRKSRGRVVLMGSNSGFMCEPFLAGYGATKHAVEAIADSLRIELRPWGIEVALIEPGAIKTPIWSKSREAAEQLFVGMPPECEKLYAAPISALRKMVEKIPSSAIPPERVAGAVAHALESRRPRTRYPVGLDSIAGSLLVRIIPDRWLDWIIRKVMGL
ncbi:SDR family oxidoreductase [Prosthecobacter vanneervenii]|uniref:NAD(P)-dependent dehydrogenase (Short-subunit alcohol dehydrogenase family) n=1 Tax=Prosthecobacter vanneervenii TaxID=48466 RepID=A0A7W8DIY0_9BACT|nr:SDR family oxidoreductase [Prosthecobacter vanneervenii]MBB5031579.1 NAD(P)-dependent dehydrogenase (short-subunit alcohol dehydrogenase family) [Prosthecobacter vanneervenii]